MSIVLAPYNYIPLLRPSLLRPPLSRLLPPALFPPPGGVFRPLTSALLMDASLRYIHTPYTFAPPIYALPWSCALVFSSVYME